MTIFEKIRFLRQQKLWSQEQMANYLGMSINGYGSIERGDTDVGLSRLEQIASLFGISLQQLFALHEKRDGFSFLGSHNAGKNTGIQTNIHCNYYSESHMSECDYLNQQFELEKQKLINEYAEKELDYLKELNAVKEREILYLKEINALKEKKLDDVKKINNLIRNQDIEEA